MRRFIRVLILVLMLITSLTAGTLAVYTSRIDLAPVEISAKRFVLGVNQGSQDELDIKIGPGELINYQFVVTNEDSNGDVSEVDMDLQINADFSAIVESLPDIVITLLMNTGSGDTLVATATSGGTLSYFHDSLFQASEVNEVDFSLSFYWNDSLTSGTQPNTNSVSLPLTIYVKGVQHVSST